MLKYVRQIPERSVYIFNEEQQYAFKRKNMLLFKSCVPTWKDKCKVTVCFTQCAQKLSTMVFRVVRTLIPWESSVPWSEVWIEYWYASVEEY